MHSEISAIDQGAARSFIEQARRQQIIDAAVETIAEYGYRSASFAAIAGRAGISPSLIPYHFRSKGELVAAVVESIDSGLDSALGAAANGAQGYAEAVRGLVEAFVRYAAEHRSQMVTIQQLMGALTPEERRGLALLERENAIAEWQDLLQEGQRAGEFGGFDARTAAVALHGMLSAVPRELFARSDIDVQRLATQLGVIAVRALQVELDAPLGGTEPAR